MFASSFSKADPNSLFVNVLSLKLCSNNQISKQKKVVVMRLDNDLRLKALDLFERGFSYKAVAHQLQLSPETVREWVYLWRALGSDLYKHSEKRPRRYSPEVKLAAVKDRLSGVPMIDVMRRYQIANRNRIKEWCVQYAKQGPSAFEKNHQVKEQS